MLILISPAKTLDYQSPLATERYTQPELLIIPSSLSVRRANFPPRRSAS